MTDPASTHTFYVARYTKNTATHYRGLYAGRDSSCVGVVSVHAARMFQTEDIARMSVTESEIEIVPIRITVPTQQIEKED